MRADREADVHRVGKFKAHKCARGLEAAIAPGQCHEEYFTLSLDADLRRPGDVRLNLMREAAGRFTKLERSQSVTVNGDVEVGRIGLEALADHQAGLAMSVAPGAEPLDGAAQSDVSRDALPDKMECIIGKPHILAATRNEIRAGRRIKGCRPGLTGFADF